MSDLELALLHRYAGELAGVSVDLKPAGFVDPDPGGA